MSNFTVTFTPGYVWQDGELWTAEKGNLAANPTINISGNPGSIVLGAGSVGITNLQAGMFTADVTGRAPFANGWLALSLIGNGIFTANPSGRAPFANGWLTAALVATGTFTATPDGRAPFANGVISAAQMQPDAYSYATGGGNGAAYTATFSPGLNTYVNDSNVPVFTTYWDGLTVRFKAPANSAQNATLNVDTLGVKNIYRRDGTQIQAGDIVSGQIVEVVYNATFNSGAGGWQLLIVPNPVQQVGVVTFPNGQSSVTVTLAYAMPSTNYGVIISGMTAWNTPQNFYATVVSTTQFTITWSGGTLSTPLNFAWLAVMKTQ